MRYRKLDDNGDFSFGIGDNNYLQGVDSVAQAIKTRILLWKYEWWEDLEDGLPMRQEILDSRDIAHVDYVIKKRIMGTKHVNSILFYDSEFDVSSREYKASFMVDTDFGNVSSEVVI